MSQRDRATVDVGLFAVEAQLFFHGDVLSAEGFVHFDEIDIGKIHPSALQSFARGWNRPAAHNARIDTSNAPVDDSAEWLRAALFGIRNRGKDNSCAPIHNAAGVAGGDHAVFAECR